MSKPIIQSSVFNAIKTKVDLVFGTGSQSFGYGQPISSTITNSRDIITAANWNLLRAEMIKARQHQTGQLIGSLSDADGLNLLPAITGEEIFQDTLTQYQQFADIITADRFLVDPAQLETSLIVNSQRTTLWNNIITQSVIVSGTASVFTSAENLRFFFNAGGTIQFNASRSGGDNNQKNIFWTEFLESIGTISFRHSSTVNNGPIGTGSNIGFHNLTTTDQIIFSAQGTGNYSQNRYNLFARLSTDLNEIVFSIQFADTAREFPVDNNVGGILTSLVYQVCPVGENVSVDKLTATHFGLTSSGLPTVEYVITPSVDVVNEGDTVTFTVFSNAVNGTVVFWTTRGLVNSADFTDNIMSGSVVINNNTASIVRTLSNDITIEGSESFFIELRLISTTGTLVATSRSVAVIDTSRYSLTVDKTELFEPILVYPTSQIEYEITNSLRFKQTNRSFLSRTPGVAGNRQKWTISAWIKRGTVSTSLQDLFTAIVATGSTTQITINQNRLSFIWNSSRQVTTTILLNDPTKWYHIVVVWDTTNANQNERIQIYVDGIKQTSFSTATYPPQNTLSFWNNTTINRIGTFTGTTNMFDGYMSEIHFVDGQALDPSNFGKFAVDTNQWIPKQYNGTYGTNGFYLDFSSTTSLITLGHDKSTNNNHWTLNNISLSDSMFDSPSNDFAVLSGTGTLSDGNLTVSGTNFRVYGTKSTKAGAFYFEAAIVSAQYAYIGIELTNGVRYVYTQTGQKLFNSASAAYGSAWLNSATIGVAYDLNNQTITFYRNGVSQGIAFDTIDTTLAARPVIGLLQNERTRSTANVNFGQRPFVYSVPSGYFPLSDNIIFSNPNNPIIANTLDEPYILSYTISTNNSSIGNTVFLTFDGDLTIQDVVGGVSPREINITSSTMNGSIEISPDNLSEQDKFFRLQLREGTPTANPIETSPLITLKDRSPNYIVGLLNPDGITVNPTLDFTLSESNTFTFFIQTQYVPNGTVLYYNPVGTDIRDSDFEGGIYGRSTVVNNNLAPCSIKISADTASEGIEEFQIEVRVGSTTGIIVHTSNPVYIASNGVIYFTTSGTFLVPNGVTSLTINAVGPGGASAGVHDSGYTTSVFTGGPGGGVRDLILPVTQGETLSIEIGRAGGPGFYAAENVLGYGRVATNTVLTRNGQNILTAQAGGNYNRQPGSATINQGIGTVVVGTASGNASGRDVGYSIWNYIGNINLAGIPPITPPSDISSNWNQLGRAERGGWVSIRWNG